MRKTLAALLTVPTILYFSHNLPAQSIEDGFIRKNPSTKEVLHDKVKHTVKSYHDLFNKAKIFVGKGVDWLGEKYAEEILEMQIEDQLIFYLADDEIRDYVSARVSDKGLSAEVQEFFEDGRAAVVEITYPVGADDAAIHRRYIFDIEGTTVKGIRSRGEEWGERWGNRMPVEGLLGTVLLERLVSERWSLRQDSIQDQAGYHEVRHELSPDGFAMLQAIVGTDYNPYDNPIIFSPDMTRAQVGVRLSAFDEFGQGIKAADAFIVEQYIRPDQEWVFDRTLVQAEFDKDMLIGTERNPYQHVPGKFKLLDKVKDRSKGIIDYLMR
ncbi:MAG: hypothetical protein ABIC95_03800 [archaeon]